MSFITSSGSSRGSTRLVAVANWSTILVDVYIVNCECEKLKQRKFAIYVNVLKMISDHSVGTNLGRRGVNGYGWHSRTWTRRGANSPRYVLKYTHYR